MEELRPTTQNKRYKILTQAKQNITLKKEDINLIRDFKVHPAFGGTFIIAYEDFNANHYIEHICADGSSFSMIAVSNKKIDFKMINQSQLIYITRCDKGIQVYSHNLLKQQSKQSKLYHKNGLHQTYENCYYFTQSKMLCILQTIQNNKSGQNCYYKCLTYYQYPFKTQDDQPIQKYVFGVQQKNNVEVFQINNISKLVCVEYIWKYDSDRIPHSVIKDIKYRFCDDKGFRVHTCKFVKATKYKCYVPIQIVQIQPQLLHIRFQIKYDTFTQETQIYILKRNQNTQKQLQQNPSLSYKLPSKQKGSLYFQTLWNYKRNQYPSFPLFNLNDINIQFLKGLRRQKSTNQNDKLKPMNICFVDISKNQIIDQQIQQKLYQRFQISHYDTNSYFDYLFQYGTDRHQVILDIKITTINKYKKDPESIYQPSSFQTARFNYPSQIQQIDSKNQNERKVQLYKQPNGVGISFVRQPNNIEPCNGTNDPTVSIIKQQRQSGEENESKNCTVSFIRQPRPKPATI